jgi:hypothetical protein
MTGQTKLILYVDLPGVHPYEIGPEIWQVPIADAIGDEADAIAYASTADHLGEPTPADHDRLRDRVVAEMTGALTAAGDSYTAPDGVRYSLTEQPGLDLHGPSNTLGPVPESPSEPIVVEVVRFDDLPLGSPASRRAIVRWSDRTEGQALAWYSDEILICEGDLVGKTMAELRSLHFRRDRDWLQS